MIYRYKNNSSNVEFNKFDNAFDIIDKIRHGKIDLSDVKNNQGKIKSYLGKKKKKETNQKNKKILCAILKYFTKQGKKLLIFMMIIL